MEVVPIAMEMIQPRSVVDVGCGTGTWLREFLNCGAASVHGIDGDYVDRERLEIPRDCFTPFDLRSGTFECERKDLAICLEVAEHLPMRSSNQLIRSLVKASQIVMFSAAVPGQGGTDHINEQWPSYWRKIFANHGYEPVDAIRPRILQNHKIEWWYRQNIMVFASKEALDRHPDWLPYVLSERAPSIEWVHSTVAQSESIRILWNRLYWAARHTITRARTSMVEKNV
jgi:SAM-dependent methyltransferase